MPSEDMMKKLDDELEAAIAAKKAQDIIKTLVKVRNEQQSYEKMMQKQMDNSKKMMSSDKVSDEEMMNAKRLDDFIEKGENALMELKED
jgi:hypothetical protein